MFEMFKRLSLTDLTPAQIAVLDALIPPAWPETWRNFATSQSTNGVLPLPPTVRFPTTMTGTGKRKEGITRQRNKARRIATMPPNSQESGIASHRIGATRLRPHKRGRRWAKP